MKSLLLVALLLAAGITTSETVVAQQSTVSSRQVKVPYAVQQAFEVEKAKTEAYGDYVVGAETWTSSKGTFTATFEVFYYGGSVGFWSWTFSRKGVHI
jgi:hypothetical protein